MQHPEVDKFGLTLDFSLASEFNKELLIRRWVQSSRDCIIHRDDSDIPTKGIEVECGSIKERTLANLALRELIEHGYLDPITYLKTF